MELQGRYKGGTREMQGRYKGSTKEVQWRYKGGTREVQGKCRRGAESAGVAVCRCPLNKHSLKVLPKIDEIPEFPRERFFNQ